MLLKLIAISDRDKMQNPITFFSPVLTIKEERRSIRE